MERTVNSKRARQKFLCLLPDRYGLKGDKKRFLAVIFILRSNINCFSGLTKDFLSGYIQGAAKHPPIIAKSFELLQHYEINGLVSMYNRNNYNPDREPRVSLAPK